jgi:hypothetical protein
MATPGQILEVSKHFLIAAIWADCEEGTHPRATIRTARKAFDVCKAFVDANLELFNAAMNRCEEGYGSHPDAGSAEAAFGHDLWLTLQGHGVGFWDRDELKAASLGDRLTKACNHTPAPSYWQSRGWFYLS